jgi:uncharacterized membrane protein YfcA
MDPATFFLIVLMSSFVAGILGSLLGLGGGVIIVPVLTLALGVPPLFAIGASIVSVIATSSGAASAYVKDRITNLRIGMFLELATTTGAITGAILTLSLARANLEGAVYVVFGLVLLFSIVPLLRKLGEDIPSSVVPDTVSKRLELRGEYFDSALGREIQYQSTRSILSLSVMYLAGLISGLLGIGSGVLKVVALDVGMKLPAKVSSTTSNFMIGVTAAASTGIFYLSGYINPFIAAPVVLGVFLGSLLGTRILVRSRNTTIRKVFVPVVALLAIEMLLHGI